MASNCGEPTKQEEEPLPTIPVGRAVSPQKVDFCVEVAPFTFLWFCAVMIFLHLLCIGFFGLQSWIYNRMTNWSLYGTLNMLEMVLPSSNFLAISCCYGGVAIIHCVLVIKILVESAIRRVSMCALKRRQQPRPFRRQLHKRLFAIFLVLAPHGRRLIHGFYHIFSERGFFGVRGQYFEAIYALRKIVAILLQSAEAYRTSQLISRVSINSIFVGIIIIHCWSTPLIHHAFKPNRSFVRFLCIMLDLMMILITGLGTPLLISVPYLEQYDYTMKDFPLYLYEDEAWFINMICELRMVFISSWGSLIGQLTLSITLLLCFSDVKALVLRKTTCKGHIKCSSVLNWRRKITQAEKQEQLSTSLYSSPPLSAIRSSKSSPSISQIPIYAANPRLIKLLHMFMAVWGFFILVLHARVTFRSPSRFCLHELHPWFVSKIGCTIVLVNCSAFELVTGNMADLTDALDVLNEEMLTKIEIYNCPHVEIPSTIQRFSQLEGMVIFNSTLARWDADAAFTDKTNPKISYFEAYGTNLTEIPLGLRSLDSPKQISGIEFAYTNLTTIPDDIGEVWPTNNLLYISVENSHLTSIPLGLLTATNRSISLVGNNISILPAEFFTKPSAIHMWLGENPIVELPDGIIPSYLIESLDLSSTQLKAFPSWADTEFFQRVFVIAGGTPFCDQLLEASSNNDTSFNNTIAWEAFQTGVLSCHRSS